MRHRLAVAGVLFLATQNVLHAQQIDASRIDPNKAAPVLLKDYLDGASEGRRTRARDVINDLKLPDLSADGVKTATAALWDAYKNSPEGIVRAAEAARGFVTVDNEPCYYVLKKMGDRGPNGYAVFLDLHGGGGGPPEMNDGDWKVHQTRFKNIPGKLVAIRAPRDTWDQFHNEYFHRFVDALCEQMILAEDADPNRIYIMGFSSGAYGTIQLGPAMPDRFAAVGCSSAATEGSLPENLRDCPFIYQVGADDNMYGRPKLAEEYGGKLKALHDADPDGYDFYYKLIPNTGHHIDDSNVVPWLTPKVRNPYPKKIVWWQNQPGRESSNPIRHQMYWVGIDPSFKRDKSGIKKITADRDGQHVTLTVDGYDKVFVRLNAEMADLDKPITITANGKEVFNAVAPRRLSTLFKTFEEKKDPTNAFPVEIEVNIAGS